MKKNKKVNLINWEKIKNIYTTYVEIVKNNGIDMFDNIVNKDYILEREEYMDEENSSNSSNSSVDSEDERW